MTSATSSTRRTRAPRRYRWRATGSSTGCILERCPMRSGTSPRTRQPSTVRLSLIPSPLRRPRRTSAPAVPIIPRLPRAACDSASRAPQRYSFDEKAQAIGELAAPFVAGGRPAAGTAGCSGERRDYPCRVMRLVVEATRSPREEHWRERGPAEPWQTPERCHTERGLRDRELWPRPTPLRAVVPERGRARSPHIRPRDHRRPCGPSAVPRAGIGASTRRRHRGRAPEARVATRGASRRSSLERLSPPRQADPRLARPATREARSVPRGRGRHRRPRRLRCRARAAVRRRFARRRRGPCPPVPCAGPDRRAPSRTRALAPHRRRAPRATRQPDPTARLHHESRSMAARECCRLVGLPRRPLPTFLDARDLECVGLLRVRPLRSIRVGRPRRCRPVRQRVIALPRLLGTPAAGRGSGSRTCSTACPSTRSRAEYHRESRHESRRIRSTLEPHWAMADAAAAVGKTATRSTSLPRVPCRPARLVERLALAGTLLSCRWPSSRRPLLAPSFTAAVSCDSLPPARPFDGRVGSAEAYRSTVSPVSSATTLNRGWSHAPSTPGLRSVVWTAA